ncbi:ankyrin repeat domain-containing protein [Aspergillus lucknowensis]|uniref:Ankyrin repeat-containing domain protein n=1 Tax=Aspergillus lucknowensis TaxID=176173 RepID=A0ABR4LW72_9EURO
MGRFPHPLPREIFLLIATNLGALERIRLLHALPLLIPVFPRKLILEITSEPCADGDAKTPAGNILHILAHTGDIALLRALLRSHDIPADIENENQQTPLLLAAAAGHLSIVKFLADREDVNADGRGPEGRSPLSFAAEMGHAEIVRYLISRKDVRPDQADVWPRTPLLWAAYRCREAVVEVLVRQENIFGLADSKDPKDKAVLETDLVGLNRCDHFSYTAFLWAVKSEHVGIMRTLMTRQDLDVRMRYGPYQSTALSWACMDGLRGAVDVLLESDRVVEGIDDEDANGWTATAWAAKQGHMDVVTLLVAKKTALAKS